MAREQDQSTSAPVEPVEADREDTLRQALDDNEEVEAMRQRRAAEDPGLLELTEDPKERRLKRNTM